MAPEATGRSLLAVLDAEHPEWRPLLRVIKEALREAERPQWARLVPALEHPGRRGRPLLDGAVINVAPRLVGRWVRHILGIAVGARHLRCGCCGGDWRTEWLRCPFCGEDDHEELGSLVSPDSLARQTIEVCDGCRGYVKTITTLAPMRPEHVVLQDLATLVLDV